MIRVAIVYHSGYGHTAKVAEAVAKGLSEVSETAVEMISIDAEGNLPESAWTMLQAADSIIFGSPTYMSGTSWQFKKFADASSKSWVAQQWKDKLFAGFTNSSSMNGDKLSTLDYMFHLAQQHGGIWAGMGMLPSNSKAATQNDVNYIAGVSGLMTVSPADASVEEAPSLGELETARLFGQRIAQLTHRWGK